MTDIFLYAGESVPTDIILSDPTVVRAGGTTFFQAIDAIAASIATISEIVTFTKIIAAGTVATASIVKQVSKTLAAVAVGISSVTRGLFISLSSVATGLTSIGKIATFNVVITAISLGGVLIDKVITFFSPPAPPTDKANTSVGKESASLVYPSRTRSGRFGSERRDRRIL